MDSVFRCELPVVTPYRLDYTAAALRRLSANLVDRFSDDGEYSRALQDSNGIAAVRVRQPRADRLDVRLEGAGADRFLPTVARMLGTDVDLRPWYAQVKTVPWLDQLAERIRGVKPPRYPTLWEALAHAIVFQQISIHAAAAIMQRMIAAFAVPIAGEQSARYPFVLPQTIAAAKIEDLRAVGLSANKVTALQSVAISVLAGEVEESSLEKLATADAIVRLSQLRGIGPWSAAVVLLRGLGRLDVFPLKDSGVAASLRLLSGNHQVSVDDLLVTLGEQRGMLYFHLLLGRLAATP